MGFEVLLERCGRPGSVGGVSGHLVAEAFDVDGDRGQNVLDVSLGQAVVAAPAHPVAVGELVHIASHKLPTRSAATVRATASEQGAPRLPEER